MGSSAIYNLIRALSHPYIGAEFEYKEKYYKVWKSEIVKSDGKYQNIEPGRIIKKCLIMSFMLNPMMILYIYWNVIQ